jgi:hypothetical protein
MSKSRCCRSLGGIPISSADSYFSGIVHMDLQNKGLCSLMFG